MHKRKFSRIIDVLSCLFLSVFSCDAADRPNIIHIMADDLGWGDLGCYGNQIAKTPNIDRMAADGTLFTQYYAAATVCSPSRAGILTGIFPARLGIHTFLSPPDSDLGRQNLKNFDVVPYLDPNIKTIADVLRESGYSTAHFGKWHLGEGKDAPTPLDYGFDEEISYRSNGAQLKEPYSSYAEQIVNAAVSYIDRNQTNPFYMHVWFRVPHTILNPTSEQMSAYRKFYPGTGNYKGAFAVYYGAVSEMDRQIGRLLAKLNELNLDGNTLVVFTSDNGAAHQYSESSHSFVDISNGPFRGRKRSLYDGGIRVPFIVRWPANVPAGKVDNQSVIWGADWFPTVCGIAGVELPKDRQYAGENIKEILTGNSVERRSELYWEWRCGSPLFNYTDISPTLAVRDGKWKFLMNHDGSMKELYDVVSDPAEQANRVDQNPEIAAELEKKLSKWQLTLPQGTVWSARKSSQDGLGKWVGF